MYNEKSIASFMDKINKEAEEAAQAIFDKHTPDLIDKIKNQMNSGDKFYIGMGTASFVNKKGDDVGEKLSITLANTQYGDNIRANFDLNDITK